MSEPGNSAPSRRQFLGATSLVGASLAAVDLLSTRGSASEQPANSKLEPGYKHRIAFGCWINDMRSQELPLQQWPAPHLDETTVSSIIAALDVQSRAGFNYLDAWGLFATYGYPPDIISAFADEARAAQVRRLIREARQRGITYLLGMGLFSWGYDQIIRADPAVRGRNKAGQPLDHVMCGATERAWSYVDKILDTALANFDFGGVHLESADLGWCDCPACGGKYGTVGYNCRLNIRAADYIKRKWPGKLVTSIPINWLGGSGRSHFDQAEQDQIIELSNHIDVFMDQGWNGTFIEEVERKAFIKKLHCDYGTSGGLWVYHCGRWDRLAYFLPHPRRSAAAIRRHYEDGARGCMFYQGPVINPGVELNIALGGRMLVAPHRTVEDALEESLELYYQPRNAHARKELVELFLQAEEAYFGQWDPQRFSAQGRSMPGELHLTDLFGTSPGPAHFLMEPFLNSDGRRDYKKGLLGILKNLASLESQCADGGRLGRIQKSITVTLMILESIRAARKES